ncbi:restriction endonuclease subunit S [Streptomyces gardneri]|nr:restriction endonuclease subunit S [Streptomyces gardneri]
MSWPKAPLRRIFRVVNGGTPTSSAAFWDGDVPWATPVDVGRVDGGYLGTTQRYLTEDGVLAGSRAVPEGSLVLSTRAPIGYVAQVSTRTAFNQGCRGLVATSPVDIRYFRYQIVSLREELVSRGAGSTFMELPSDGLASLPLSIPPIDEQRRIADFLDAETSKVDLLVEASARQSDLLAESLREAIRVATTTHSGPTVSTGVDWMPHINAAWRLAKVGHVFMTGSGTTPSSEVENYFNGVIPWVNSADLNDRGISSTIRNVSHEARRDYPALKIHPAGSLIVAMYGQGETKGRVGLLGFDACVNQACCVLTPMDGINASFASYWFRAHKDGVVALAVGAGQPNLSQELIRQLRIPIPDVKWQDRIVAELQELEDSIATRSTFLDSRSRLLTERRQALITAAVTGRIDVTTTRRFTPSESVSV